jgi:hypothetical protein
MNFGKPAWWDQTYNGGVGQWDNDWTAWTDASDYPKYPIDDTSDTAFGECNNERNNGRERDVIAYYRPPQGIQGVTNSARNGRITVSWVNIHSR